MSSAKRFLFILAAVALVVWIGVNVVLGPPGLSSEYREQYKADHDYYIEITKSDAYKLCRERPDLHGPGAEGVPENLADQVAFVEAYEARPEFQAEQRRMGLYSLFFDFFNASLVVIIVWRFGRKPLLSFLDEQVATLRARMDAAAEARASAQARKEHAEGQIAQVPEERQRMHEETEARLARELAELAEANEHSIAIMEQELADRKRKEAYAAELLVKREMVDGAVGQLRERYRGWHSPESQTELFERFVAGVEKLS